MGLLTPGLGLLVWMLITFSVLFFVLWKFGWPVMIQMMKDR
jgi:F-type H+-transporting ATPase subunit b